MCDCSCTTPVLTHLKLPAVQCHHFCLLSNAEGVGFGAGGGLYGVGEFFALLLNHNHRFDIFAHLHNHFRCT